MMDFASPSMVGMLMHPSEGTCILKDGEDEVWRNEPSMKETKGSENVEKKRKKDGDEKRCM